MTMAQVAAVEMEMDSMSDISLSSSPSSLTSSCSDSSPTPPLPSPLLRSRFIKRGGVARATRLILIGALLMCVVIYRVYVPGQDEINDNDGDIFWDVREWTGVGDTSTDYDSNNDTDSNGGSYVCSSGVVSNCTSDDKCCISQECDDFGGLLDYSNFYHCSCGIGPVCVVFLYVPWLVMIFYLLGMAAEDYFCPILSVISDRMNLSPDVAGITILALGNGSPDVFSTFVAVTNDQFPLSIGALIGAGCFVTMAVVGAVVFVAPCKVQKLSFVRDVVFYFCAVSTVTIILFRKAIHLWESMMFLVGYVCYVAFSVFMGWYGRRKEKRKGKGTETEPLSPTHNLTEDELSDIDFDIDDEVGFYIYIYIYICMKYDFFHFSVLCSLFFVLYSLFFIPSYLFFVLCSLFFICSCTQRIFYVFLKEKTNKQFLTINLGYCNVSFPAGINLVCYQFLPFCILQDNEERRKVYLAKVGIVLQEEGQDAIHIHPTSDGLSSPQGKRIMREEYEIISQNGGDVCGFILIKIFISVAFFSLCRVLYLHLPYFPLASPTDLPSLPDPLIRYNF